MATLGKLTPILDHIDQGLSKLLQIYRDKPRFKALLSSYIRQVQDLEDATWAVIESRDLDAADELRAQLLGKLVGQSWRGESLSVYKLYIRARVLVNRSLGRAADVIQIAKVLLVDQEADYWEGQPAYFDLRARTDLHPDVDPHVLVEMVREAKAGGVGFAFVYPTVATEISFQFSSEADPSIGQIDTNQGFSSTTETTLGGRYASVIR